MALIPPDAGIRMRMQLEANLLQPTAPVREIAAELPTLIPGQTFSARIEETLPNNIYRALVAGKAVTLQLPEGAEAGDTLELVVVDRTSKAIVAQLAKEQIPAAAPREPYPFATLSRTGQMLAQLLLPEGTAPQPAPLNRGQPLLPQPPLNATELAPQLEKAVVQSGLFYEAHQVQWLAGKLPMEQLLAEPQAQHSATPLLRNSSTPTTPDAAVPANIPVVEERAPAAPAIPQTLSPATEGRETSTSQQTAATASLAQSVPEELRPLVQQQLDAAGTQRLVWHGEIWPNQSLDWEVEWEKPRDDGNPETNEERAWRTTLRLSTPRLGQVDAAIQLTSAGVRVALTTPYGASAADLRDEAPRLTTALSAAGIPLLAFQVKHESR